MDGLSKGDPAAWMALGIIAALAIGVYIYNKKKGHSGEVAVDENPGEEQDRKPNWLWHGAALVPIIGISKLGDSVLMGVAVGGAGAVLVEVIASKDIHPLQKCFWIALVYAAAFIVGVERFRVAARIYAGENVFLVCAVAAAFFIYVAIKVQRSMD